jgi:hypothetical protein
MIFTDKVSGRFRTDFFVDRILTKISEPRLPRVVYFQTKNSDLEGRGMEKVDINIFYGLLGPLTAIC